MFLDRSGSVVVDWILGPGEVSTIFIQTTDWGRGMYT